jgi:hypothetical protein
MGTIKSEVQARTSLTTTALNALSSANFTLCGTLTHATNDPLDVLLEVQVVAGAVSGNKQAIVYAKGSLDGTNFESGIESGTATTTAGNLTFVGVVPCPEAGTHNGLFSLADAFGVMPHSTKVIIHNDSGAAFTSGGWVQYSEVWAVTA